MSIPFRNNPKITTNWVHQKTQNVLENKTKKAYYEISATQVPGSLTVFFREEKKRLGGSAERAEFWFSHLGFELDSTFARDLKMFLNEFVDGDNEETKNTVRLYPTSNGKWVAKKGSGEEVEGKSISRALINLSTTVSKSIINNSKEKSIPAKKR